MNKSQAEIKAIATELQSIRTQPSRVQSSDTQPIFSPPSSHPNSSRPALTPPPASILPDRLNPVSPNPVLPQATQTASNQTMAKRRTATPHLPPIDLSMTVEKLQQRSSSYLDQLKQFQAEAQGTPADRIREALQRLDRQAQRINRLAQEQEAALLELKAITDTVEQDRKTLEQAEAIYLDKRGVRRSAKTTQPLCQYQPLFIPYVEKTGTGELVVQTRSIDLHKAEREAVLTAEALRGRVHRSSRPKTTPWIQAFQTSWLRFFSRVNLLTVIPIPTQSQGVPEARRSTHLAQQSAQRSRVSQSVPALAHLLTLRESLILVVAAVVARVLLDLIAQAVPFLWLPMIIVMVAPLAIGVYRSTITRRSGVLWACRLSLILLGLLLGGRL